MTLNWRIACLTVGNEHLFFPFNHRCCLLFYLLRRVVLPVEHQPASGRAPGAGGATLSLRPAPGTYAAMPARILASIAGRGVAAGVLVGAGSCAGPSAAFDDRWCVDATARGADFSLPPSARLAHVIASGRGPHRRGATAIPALAGAGGSGMERATADPHGGTDAGPHLPGFLALSHQHYLAAAGTIAGIAAGKLARAASDLVSAAVYRQSVAATGVTC